MPAIWCSARNVNLGNVSSKNVTSILKKVGHSGTKWDIGAAAAARPLKALIVMSLAEQRGGAELALLHLLQAGRGMGVEWTVVFQEDGPMVAQTRALGVDARVIPAGRLRQPHRVIGSVLRIARILRRERFDLALAWMVKPQLYSGPAAWLAGKPAFWFQMGMPDGTSWLDRAATALPTRGVLACSHISAAAQAKMRPARAVRAIHLAAELDRFDPARLPAPDEVRRELGLPTGVPIVGIVGRLQRWKGMHTLVDAMPALLGEFPDLRCLIVGGEHALEPDYLPYLKERIAAQGLADRVILAGQQRDVPRWMQAMDVIVHASGCEPFGIVVIEAMALAKPVVAGDQGGPTEVITPGVNGLFAPFGDSAALATAIGRYLRDPQWAQDVGRAARERAMDFSTERFAQNVIAALREMLPGGIDSASGSSPGPL